MKMLEKGVGLQRNPRGNASYRCIRIIIESV